MGAFGDCPRLTGIALPTSVTNVELWAFRGCINLKAITVDALNPVYSSGEGVVFDKKQTAVVLCPPGKTGSYRIPNAVTNIISSAFLECTKLTGVLLPGQRDQHWRGGVFRLHRIQRYYGAGQCQQRWCGHVFKVQSFEKRNVRE